MNTITDPTTEETIYASAQTEDQTLTQVLTIARTIRDNGTLELLKSRRCSVAVRTECAQQFDLIIERCIQCGEAIEDLRPEEIGTAQAFVNAVRDRYHDYETYHGTQKATAWLGVILNTMGFAANKEAQIQTEVTHTLADHPTGGDRPLIDAWDYGVTVDDEHDQKVRLEDTAQAANFAQIAYEDDMTALRQLYLELTGSIWDKPPSRVGKIHPNWAATHSAANNILAGHEASHCDPTLSWRVAIFGGHEFTDHTKIFACLDSAKTKHPTMTVYTGTQTKGTEAIVRAWCETNSVQCIPEGFPYNGKSSRAAFDRNRKILDNATLHAIILFPSKAFTTGGFWKEEALKRNIALWSPLDS